MLRRRPEFVRSSARWREQSERWRSQRPRRRSPAAPACGRYRRRGASFRRRRACRRAATASGRNSCPRPWSHPSQPARTPRSRPAGALRLRADRCRCGGKAWRGRTGWFPAAARRDGRQPARAGKRRSPPPVRASDRPFPRPPSSASARMPAPTSIDTPKRSPPATPPAVLTRTAERASVSGEGKRTRSEPASCTLPRRVTPPDSAVSNATDPTARLAAKTFDVSAR